MQALAVRSRKFVLIKQKNSRFEAAGFQLSHLILHLLSLSLHQVDQLAQVPKKAVKKA